MINAEVEKLQKLYDEKSLKYHDETNFGSEIEPQSKYNSIFKQLRR